MQVAVQKPFEAQLPEARERLMQLLRHTAIRASKDDLEIMVRRTHKVEFECSLPTLLNQVYRLLGRTCAAGQRFVFRIPCGLAAYLLGVLKVLPQASWTLSWNAGHRGGLCTQACHELQ